jgi:excisionase family DNA binding protein
MHDDEHDPAVATTLDELDRKILDRRRRLLAAPNSLSTAEAASRFGTSRRTIERAIRAGTIPAFRVGRVVRIPLAAIEAIERGEPIPPPTPELVALAALDNDAAANLARAAANAADVVDLDEHRQRAGT